MAGQPEAADDLIAELAKLMAQDSKPPAAPEQRPAAPAFSLRIPGADNGTAPAAAPIPTPPSPPATAPVASAPEADPFRFDFDFMPAKTADSPAPQPAPVRPAPAPIRAAEATPAPTRPAEPAPVADEHDSIADLIAAELAASTQPAPQPVVTAPAPVAVQPVAVQPAAVKLTAEPAATPAPTAGEPTVSQTQAVAPSELQAPRTTGLRQANLTTVTPASVSSTQDLPARAPLRSVNLQPVSRPEVDRFKVPPVFGLGTTPAVASSAPVEPSFAPPPQPPVQELAAERREPEAFPAIGRTEVREVPAEPDPIDEIESLIGRAVRVEREAPQRQPAPEVATTRPAPKPPVGRRERNESISSVDEAILAAAAATGAQVGWVDPSDADEPVLHTRNQRPRRSKGITRALAGPLVAITLLLAAGFGLYWVLGLGRDAGPAPLLTADASPAKETPAVEPDAGAAQQSVVFNEIDGVVPGAEEQLVSRDQADVNEVTQVAVPVVSEEGLANRKVRTVTVRPDGTIVSGDDSVAGSAILPVARPLVPDVPGAETASPELTAAAAGDAATATTTPADTTATPATTTTPVAEPVATTPTVTPVVPGSTVPAVDAAGNALAGKTAPVPMLRPSGLQGQAATPSAGFVTEPTSPVNAVVDTPLASLPPAPSTAAPIAGATEVAALPNNAPAYVQLASQRTEAEARQTASALITRYGPLFGGADMEVQRVDLGTRGVYYRVRVPATSLENANNMCTQVKAAGGDCFTM